MAQARIVASRFRFLTVLWPCVSPFYGPLFQLLAPGLTNIWSPYASTIGSVPIARKSGCYDRFFSLPGLAFSFQSWYDLKIVQDHTLSQFFESRQVSLRLKKMYRPRVNKFDKSNPRRLGLLFCCVSAVPLLCGVVEYLTQPQRPLAGLLQFALFPATGLLAYFLCFHVLGHKKISQYFVTGLVVSAVNMLALYISMQLNGFALEDIYLLFIDLVLCLGAFVDACVVILLVKMASFGRRE